MVYSANDGAKPFGFLFDYRCAIALVRICVFFYGKGREVMQDKDLTVSLVPLCISRSETDIFHIPPKWKLKLANF